MFEIAQIEVDFYSENAWSRAELTTTACKKIITPPLHQALWVSNMASCGVQIRSNAALLRDVEARPQARLEGSGR